MRIRIEFSTHDFDEAVKKVKKLMIEEDFVLESIKTDFLYGNDLYVASSFLIKMVKGEIDY